jgi:adenosine deaminase
MNSRRVPLYFGGYLNENFAAAQEGLSLPDEDLAQLARNSFEAAFLPPEENRRWCAEWSSTSRPPERQCSFAIQAASLAMVPG